MKEGTFSLGYNNEWLHGLDFVHINEFTYTNTYTYTPTRLNSNDSLLLLYIQEILILRKLSARSSVGNSIPSCKLGWNFAFQAPAGRFGMAIRILRKNKRSNNKNKAESFFRINFNVYTLMWITEKKLDQGIKNKGDQFGWEWE